MAKAQASQAVDRACRAALQCHGAIGYTFEYDLQLWLKRGWAMSAACGDGPIEIRSANTLVLPGQPLSART